MIDTKDGSHIVGKISKIDAGKVVVTTSYAGDITISQSEVTGITTDAPLAVRLSDGTRIEGRVSGSGGALQVAGTDGTITTMVSKVAASWAAGDKDPQILALERKWSYEAHVDVAGTSGNKSQLGTAAGLRATLKGPDDTLAFYTSYNRQVTEGETSADQFKAGVDYADNFSGGSSWFIRDEGGFDRVMGIRFYDVAAAGYGFDVLKDPNQTLTARAGVSFRDDTYENPLTPDVNAVGLDFEVNHEAKFGNSSLVNRISIVPAFSNFSDFTLSQESYFEIPTANPHWKLRFGVNNDYNSEPGVGLKKLDTGYFTRLVLDWQ
jgi:putative salt-induced outer membrane protein YdiY